jgi:uncharacterized protein (DUF2132 family)
LRKTTKVWTRERLEQLYVLYMRRHTWEHIAKELGTNKRDANRAGKLYLNLPFQPAS